MSEDLVTDRFRIDNDVLKELSEDDEYWENSYYFFLEVRDKSISLLTDKQISWLEKIEEGLEGVDE